MARRANGGRGFSMVGLFGATCAMAIFGSACAHANAGSASAGVAAEAANGEKGSGGDSAAQVAAAIAEGKYAVESIRSRATIDGIDQIIEISESGSTMKDRSGNEHTLTERGALTLGGDGVCQLALAVSVDGEAPGVSERACNWKVEGARFFLGESGAGTRTLYKVKTEGDHLILEGVSDVGADGKILGDAQGERIVLVQGRGPLGSQTATTESKVGTEDASTVESPSADEI